MITPGEALGQLLPSYRRYYDVSEAPHGSFAATARFYTRGEQYFLIRSAKMWEMESNEYVYFLTADALTTEQLQQRIEEAWSDTMPQVRPSESHRNSDVTLVVLVPQLDAQTRKALRHFHRSVGYRHGLHGWSNLRLGAIELSDGRITTNRHGADLKKLLGNINLFIGE
ncbi:MAG: hypothetical protein IJV64_11590 [Oscillospiraceae bacterium]|nr:hypothetical protein [Oscillospiraceae bacterium]